RTPYNSARVTVQRTNVRNGEVGLFFARIFNRNALPLSATATATYEGSIAAFEFNENYPDQKCHLLPFTIHKAHWDAAFSNGSDLWTRNPETGTVTPGPDGIKEVKLFPTKTGQPGNWGTWDIGSSANSTARVKRQILNGPSKEDFEAFGQ